MASREKKPLAPSTKSRQKGSNECTLPLSINKNKKGKATSLVVDSVVETTINTNTANTSDNSTNTTAIETAGSNSNNNNKLEVLSSRKKVIVKCKKKLRVNNNNSGNKNNIKNNKTRNVPVKNLKRLTNKVNNNKNNIISGNRKGRPRTVNKKSEGDNKLSVKDIIVEYKDDKNIDSSVPSTDNFHLKQSKKLSEINKSAKPNRLTGNKKTPSTVKDIADFKYLKTRKTTSSSSSSSSSSSPPTSDTKNNCKLNIKSSIDITIDQVLAMVNDSEFDDISIGDMEKTDGKITRSKKILIDENDIKKEVIDNDNEKSDDDNNSNETSDDKQSGQVKRKSNQRSLRNGKLRQLDKNNDADVKKSRRFCLENDTTTNENDDDNSELALSESVKNDLEKNKDSTEISIEINTSSGGSSNNGNTMDIDDIDGVNLRSKTKVKNQDLVKCLDDVENSDESNKKSLSLDQNRKDCLLGKLGNDKQQIIKRRSSLNIDIAKKCQGLLFNNEETTSTGSNTASGIAAAAAAAAPKSQIDQMIENIKLNIKLGIAKSIEESKAKEGEKAFGIGNKTFEIGNNKIDDIITPLSNDNKKLCLDEIEDNKLNIKNHNINNNNNSNNNNNNNSNKSNISESSNDTNDDNSIPKVADTAKEIEKLVMGDSELTVDKKTAESAQQNSSRSDNNDSNMVSSESPISDITPSLTLISPTSSKQSKSEENLNISEDHSNTPEITEKNPEEEEEAEDNQASLEEKSNVENCEEASVDDSKIKSEDNNEEKVVEATQGDNNGADMETLESISMEIEKLIADEVEADKQEDKDDDEKCEISESSNDLEVDQSSTSNEETEVSEKIQSSNDSTLDEKSSPVKIEDKSVKEEEVKSPGEEVKCNVDDGRRVLRTRDKQKKVEKNGSKTAESSEIIVKTEPGIDTTENQDVTKSTRDEPLQIPKTEEVEPQIRTRRSREVKKRKDDSPVQNILKTKRNRRDLKKNEQQNKEETLLDNEVAKINENKRSFTDEKCSKRLEGTESLRVFSVDSNLNKDDNRSKSENDIDENNKEKSDGLNKRFSVNETKENENVEVSDVESKLKSPENLTKDFDAASTSGESTSSVSLKLLETPEEKVRKESILRMLGLESVENAAERLNNQKAKREQYTSGTLKTVIRVQKEKDKKRSRSPIKMILKQGRNDGEGDSPEFYTIQKELGTSGLGDSSSGANRKFSTNHRQSCDEDVEEPTSKERQPLIIPEKSSSFSIHPGRLCADNCCYCFGKFGSLDTPMHLAQLKSDERRKKILNIERHLTKDSCLCDACYRHVDRKANMSPTNTGGKSTRVHRQLLVSKCYVKDCREPSRHLVKRRWLHKIKGSLQNRLNIDINWEPNQHTSMSFCADHYGIIEKFLICSLCTRRLARNQTHPLASTETEELNRILDQQGIPIPLEPGTFVCKLCRYFTQIQLKYKDIENMNNNHKSFSKNYRKRILHYNGIEISDNDNDEDESQNCKEKRKKISKTSGPSTSTSTTTSTTTTPTAAATERLQSKPNTLKVSDDNNSSEKSTPEPVKMDSLSSEIIDNDSSSNSKSANLVNDDNTNVHIRDNHHPPPLHHLNFNHNLNHNNIPILDVESAIEKLKKRKALDQHLYQTDSPIFSNNNNGDVVEILAMDKEVTLTRLPKRPKLNNDIAPVVQRLGANPSISVRTLFPGEEEMGLHANIEFSNVRELTPQGWEKCATIIQYDRDTKLLWQELQRPYGNQSSFLRHLILLEKYYRSGDLILAPNASRNAINYSTSVQNRLISYEGPEKMDEPITEPMSNDFIPSNNSKRLSGGYLMEQERLSLSIPSSSTLIPIPNPNSSKSNQRNSQQSNNKALPKILKFHHTSGVSIIKKPPPNLQRLDVTTPSPNNSNCNSLNAKRKDGMLSNKNSGSTSGGKVFQLSEPAFKKFQTLKKQKTMLEKMSALSSSITTTTSSTTTAATTLNNSNCSITTSSSSSSSTSSSPAALPLLTATSTPKTSSGGSKTILNPHPTVQYQKAQITTQTQFQKDLRMQQEMLNRRGPGDFEPLICDVRPQINENTPAQNLLNNLNLPKSIQVTTKPSSNIPILPKIPKSLTVIPQTVSRSSTAVDK